MEFKVMDFGGLERDSNQPNRNQNLKRVTNMDTHNKPGTLTLRPGYEKRYDPPNDDTLLRIENNEFISFDNFFEKTAGIGTEVTVEVSKSEIVSPTVNGSKITDYKFNAVNIFIRPHWNGSHWLNTWQWLNETWISKITSAPDATYKNKIKISGFFGNFATFTIINVTKDSTNASAILRSEQDGSNTVVWIDLWGSDWEVDDEVVIMRNYIPIKYLIENYKVLRKEISFHRIFSRMRIGFGGKQGRIGLAIEYSNRTIQMADYRYDAVDPLLLDKEFVFATINKVVVEPYTLFGETAVDISANDYSLHIDRASGNFDEGTYYARLTGMLNGTDEILIAEVEFTSPGTEKFLIKPLVKVGSLSRRLTQLKTYFSENGDDYYLVEEFVLQQNGNLIESGDWEISDDGYFIFKVASSSTDLHTEDNAMSAADINAVGNWTSVSPGQYPLDSVAASNFALELESLVTGVSNMRMIYPLNLFEKVPNKGKAYTIELDMKGSIAGACEIVIIGNIAGVWSTATLNVVPVGTGFTTETFEVTIPTTFDDLSAAFISIWFYRFGEPITTGDKFTIESFTFTENDTQFRDTADELGTQMLTELGYQATFNLVRDWMDAVVINGITWLAGTYIEKRRANLIFGSHISGLTANMHDVIPAQKFLDVDEYKGEVVVGIAVLSNDSMIAIKDGAVIILDPNTGQTFETAIGFGGTNKNSILVIRSTVYWGSQDDIMTMSASTGYIAKEASDRYVRGIYQSIPDKTNAHAVLDKYGAYRIALTDDKEGIEYPELLLTNRGWLDQVRYHHPQVYRNGLAGRVWFMNDGTIYAFPFDEAAFVGYADVYGNYDSGW